MKNGVSIDETRREWNLACFVAKFPLSSLIWTLNCICIAGKDYFNRYIFLLSTCTKNHKVCNGLEVVLMRQRYCERMNRSECCWSLGRGRRMTIRMRSRRARKYKIVISETVSNKSSLRSFLSTMSLMRYSKRLKSEKMRLIR